MKNLENLENQVEMIHQLSVNCLYNLRQVENDIDVDDSIWKIYEFMGDLDLLSHKAYKDLSRYYEDKEKELQRQKDKR